MKIISYKTELAEELINKTIDILKKGGLVIYPSDTVYGLLVDATNEEAVKKLIKFKNRPLGKPISIFASDFSMFQNQVKLSETQLTLVHELLPGPFTLILSAKHRVSRLLESEKGTLGIRIPDYQFITDLVKQFNKPVSATSANLSGSSPHYSIESFLKELPESKKTLIDLVIDAGKLPHNKPSTIIDLTSARIKILRRGEIVFKEKKLFISESETQTKKIAQYILKKISKGLQKKLLILIIEGDLGVGKTVFVKGIAEFLGIKNIISPTFVIYYEYSVFVHSPKGDYSLQGGFFKNKLVHIDLYNIQDPEEFKHLGLEKYLKPGNILCFEWGEKAGEIIDLLKQKGKVVYIDMKYINEKSREIKIKF